LRLNEGKIPTQRLGVQPQYERSGAIRRVYETNGAAMYEVAVPQKRDTWAAGYYISDWAEDVLQVSNNELLKSSKANHALNAH